MNLINKLKKITFFSLIFSISPFFMFLSFEGSISIICIFPLIFLDILYFLFKHKEKIYLNTYSKYMIFLNITYIISFGLNSFIHNVNLYCIIQLIYHFLILLWFLFNNQNEYKKSEIKLYIDCVIICSVLASLFIIYYNYFLNIHISSIKTFFGNSLGKNYFTIWISLAILLCFYMILYSSKKIKYIVFSMILTFGLIFTNSRGGWLSLIFSGGLLFIFFILDKRLSFKKILTILLIILLVPIFSKTLINYMPSWIYNRTFKNSYVDNSNLDRISSWKNGLNGFLDQPLIGFGPGIFSFVEDYQTTSRGVKVGDSTPSHNTFIDEALKGGIIGLIFFFLLFFKLAFSILKKDKIYLPILFHVLINCMILGAGKTLYLWNTLIFLIVILKYIEKNSKESNIFKLI